MATLNSLGYRIGLLEHTHPYRTFALVGAAVLCIAAFNIWAHKGDES